MAGLEINILRQWTTGPPSLRIWWSGLKSGGPENYSAFRTIHFHLKFITECVQLLIRYWQFTIWTVSVDNSGRCASSPTASALPTQSHMAAVVPKQPQKSALPLCDILSLWLAPIVFRTACLPAIVSNLFLFPSGKSTPKLMTTAHALTFAMTAPDEPEPNNMTRKWMTQCGMLAATSSE